VAVTPANTALPQAFRSGEVSVFNGIPNVSISDNLQISFTVPPDAFASPNVNAVVTLTAALPDGKALPSWMSFDPVTGRFEGQVPEGLDTAIEVFVTATDQDGNEVTTSFKIGDIQPNNEPGNDEQSELQLLLKHKRKLALIEGGFEGHPGFGEQLASASRLGPGPSQTLLNNAIRALQSTG
jgi:hypothetical protein